MTEAIRGQEDTISVTTRNTGVSPTGATFDVTVYLIMDEIPSLIEKVGDLAVSAFLGIEETRTIKVPARVPSVRKFGEHLWLVEKVTKKTMLL